MALSLRLKKGPTKFQQASDGSMTLIEHVRELRNRLFVASLGLVVGLVVGFVLSQATFDLLKEPYCSLPGAIDANGACKEFVQLSPATGFIIKLKIALWVGIVVSAPVWLYQLWAFIAPGLHRHERKWAYVFVALAAPLFAGGAVLAYAVVDKGLEFLLDAGVTGAGTTLEASAYVDFVTSMILLFGVAFEFPLILLMLNFTGVASARRLLSWWRVVVFLSFAFAAVATPDPGPFGMTLLAASLSALYFIAVGVAFINDRRRGRGKEIYAGLDDDQLSPLEEERVPVGASDPIEAPTAIDAPAPVDRPASLERRFDDMT
ncbi:twin-arginine translocase subunit TatC [Actinoplanes sp. NPDC051861]|uniref:twin-arginine translocase subunit TatC n=1 Tax=Actinoplanes sp. NPDC051861 TaxID=3155170 RepID=UPI003429E1AF